MTWDVTIVGILYFENSAHYYPLLHMGASITQLGVNEDVFRYKSRSRPLFNAKVGKIHNV